jgi:hypothetical protein
LALTIIWQKRFAFVFVSAGKNLKITFYFFSAKAVAGKKRSPRKHGAHAEMPA